MKKLFLLSIVLLLSACGSKLDGTYSGLLDLTFKPNGKVSMVMAGVETETPYEVDGDKIKFRFQGGSDTVLTLKNGGVLDGGILGKFTKK